ncbi:DivIVA domain-containing protein [Lawsonibacter sp. LCP25S3_G6]|uniref:DivIVA domain-containing protein n=1 Tax=unclassified Lawsonibacter TaxID=2617946 RepID=UPI003F9AF2B6
MLTPQEVSERAFQKASFGGYNMSQVDEFLDILTGDYSALYSENAVLKSKMKVLVDKVEEYRSTEEAMRKALMTAQRMADELVQEAERKKEEILKEAEAQASARKANISKELEAEEFRLQQAQKATASFVEQVRALHAQHSDYLDHLQELYPPETTPVVDAVEETVSEIDDNVQRLLAQAMKDATEENLRSKAAQEASQEDLDDTAEFDPVSDQEDGDEDDEDDDHSFRGSRIDFGELQFGRDYEIK